jgi:hypothetical protein
VTHPQNTCFYRHDDLERKAKGRACYLANLEMRAAAPWHGIDVTAHDGSAAGLYRQHHLALVEA